MLEPAGSFGEERSYRRGTESAEEDEQEDIDGLPGSTAAQRDIGRHGRAWRGLSLA